MEINNQVIELKWLMSSTGQILQKNPGPVPRRKKFQPDFTCLGAEFRITRPFPREPEG
jgi:hypothetical protein